MQPETFPDKSWVRKKMKDPMTRSESLSFEGPSSEHMSNLDFDALSFVIAFANKNRFSSKVFRG